MNLLKNFNIPLKNVTMKRISKEILEIVGFENTLPGDYLQKDVVLRDGRNAIVWVHKQTGHGILDSQFWEMPDFYDERYRNEHDSELGKRVEPSDNLQIYHALNKKQFRLFERYLGKDTKYLEVGCSFGGVFSRAAKIVGICHGIEPNKKDARFLQQKNNNVTIFNSTFEETSLPKDFYDIVVGIEVLEHTVSPKAILNKCSFVLKAGGVLFLEVPNHNDILLITYKDKGYERFYYHKAHVHYFTKDSLLALCNQWGFSGEVSSFLMYPFFNHVWWTQNHIPQGSAVSALSTTRLADDTPAGRAINEFYQKTEAEYERMINEYMLGDCLVFCGRKV